MIPWLVLALGLAAARCAWADDPAVAARAASKPVVPPGLPRYQIVMRLETEASKVEASERVTFTNRTSKPATELVFHVYPRYKVPDSDRLILLKTLEMLRLSPEEAMDAQGHRMAVKQVRVAGAVVPFQFDPKDDTILVVPLKKAVEPGQSVEAEIEFTLDLPDRWGRWGRHQGVTFLANWYPVLAFHDDAGWERTPFVPWHQPWHQEAGSYTVVAELPEKQVVASTGKITKHEQPRPGWQRLTIEARAARDFALVCSDRFRVWERMAAGTQVRVVALPEHEANAVGVLDFACEVIPLYERWFGPYADDEFEVTTAFFGWNGNECSGLVWIDDRVMRMPSAGLRYLDHLVTHETCHQWFWNVVGTDGYAETFMDEGIVNCFTALRLDAKYGRNAPLIAWPKNLSWLPSIGREDLRMAGYYGWRSRGNNGAVIQDLKAMGNLNALFSLAYDRGGKVMQMMYNRIGPEKFFAFWQKIYHDYAYKTFRYEDLKRELASFDPASNWPAFLDAWLVEHAETDWSVQRVDVRSDPENDKGRRVRIELRQGGEMVEPTVVMLVCGQQELRVPIWPDADHYEVAGATVDRRADRWIVEMSAPGQPSQVEVDPDHALLDARPDNNRWKPAISWRVTPFMSPLDESSQFQTYDRTSIVAGPFIDQYARGGFKVGAQRVDQWAITAWAGTEPALREAIFGGQATLFHMPWPKWSTGFFYEEGLYNFYNDQRHSGGRAFLRYRFLESPSFLLDDQGFAELYYGLGNEFWAGDDGRPVNAYLGAVGGRYHLSTLFPYWDPVSGYEVDVTAEYGNTLLGSALDYVRCTAEYGIVRSLPVESGYWSRVRLALRGYGGIGFPDTATLFRLGGGRRLRALDLTQFEGNAVWIGTAEVRFPLWREINQDGLDHVVGFRNLSSALFYDVGQTFLAGRANPIIHGVGIGLRLDCSLFSFLERANLRVDIAQPVNLPLGPVIWFGLNQVF